MIKLYLSFPKACRACCRALNVMCRTLPVVCESRSLDVVLTRYCTWCSSDAAGLVGSLVCFVSGFVYYVSVPGQELVTRVASL